jgi:branched-chain amino acid transport system ATP-binding protein
MLILRAIQAGYGNIRALKGVSLHVNEGEIVTLIGPNGAGKTTTLKTISGILKPGRGKIFFEGEEIAGLSAEQIVQRGLSHVPEGRRVFATMTVRSNLEMGAFTRQDRDRVKREINEYCARFPVLGQRAGQLAGTLSGGEQQVLAIVRALMSRPRLLIMDEPSMGLAPKLVKEIFDIIIGLREEGATILLIEQNARAALKVADRGYVLETGKVVLQGKSDYLLNHTEVQRAYLGKGYREVWEDA